MFSLIIAVSALDSAAARQLALPDTAKTPAHSGTVHDSTAKADSSRDSLSIKTPRDSSDEGIDSIVTYSAKDSIVYRIHSRSMHLVNKAEAIYEAQHITSHIIDVDFVTSNVTSYGIPDSSGKNQLGTPIFDDKGELYQGNAITYNFRTKQGTVVLANTKMETGYYYGDKIKRVSEDVMFVKNGRYTTCDLPHPHFYFESPEMEVILKDRVFAEPVYFYVDSVPLFVIPFGVFPNKEGRQSGILIPGYGDETTRGFFLQNLGYYFALNDYTDFAATTDLYTKGSSTYTGTFRYDLRYDFTGNITAGYARTRFEPDDPITTQWNFQLNHDQTIDPQTQLDAHLNFESQQYLQTTSTNINDLLQSIIYSQASGAHSWDFSSLGLNYERSQNLETKDVSQSASTTYTLQQFYPFRSSETVPGSEKWYELLGVAYSGNFQAAQSVNYDTLGNLLTNTFQYGVQHSPTISFTPKLGQISLTPSFTYSELWYPERVLQYKNPGDSLVETTTEKGLYRVWWYNTSVSATTRLYGIVEPDIFGVTAIRHTLIPSISLTYQPDFSTPRYSYYGTYYDWQSQQNVQYSYFQNEIFGAGPGPGMQKSIGISLDNIFEMKVRSSDTATTKIQLLDATLSTNYNFAADSFQLAPIAFSAHTNILNTFNIQGSGTFSPYYYDADSGRRLNVFKWQRNDGILDPTSFSFSVSTQFALWQGGGGQTGVAAPGMARPDTSKQPTSAYPLEDSIIPKDSWAYYMGEDGAGNTPMKVPLSLALTYSFSQIEPFPGQITSRTSALSATLTMKVTPTWSMSTSVYYDFVAGTVQAPSVSMSKDLHCWQLDFTWYPTGYLQGFYLNLHVKAPQLNDVKVTKRDNTEGLY